MWQNQPGTQQRTVSLWWKERALGRVKQINTRQGRRVSRASSPLMVLIFSVKYELRSLAEVGEGGREEGSGEFSIALGRPQEL